MQKIIFNILNLIFGLFLFISGCFLTVSLITLSESDPNIANFTSNEIINNFFGYFGSYVAGSTYVFFGNTSYLIAFFILILGFKKIFSFKTSFLLLKLLAFILSILAFSIISSYWSLSGGVIGIFLLEIINLEFSKFFLNQIIFLSIVFFLHVLSLLLLFFSFSISYKIIFTIIKPLALLFIFLFKKIKIMTWLNLFKIKKSHSLNSDFNNFEKETVLKETKIKKEPTIKKGLGGFNSVNKNNLNIAPSDKNSSEYKIPPFSLLVTSTNKDSYPKEIERQNAANAIKLENILKEYGVLGKITNFKTGPVITLFEFEPSAGVKTSKVIGLSPDIARSMASMSARISSQPGKNSIGIEIPNQKRYGVYLGDLVKDNEFDLTQKGLVLALGKNTSGEKIYTDLERMPHLLIAGTTGSGKSVGINSMLISLLFRFKPSECKFILIDPKMLELSVYENIPHLLTPVVTDPKKAVFALKWVVREMENRYRIMNAAGVKNIQSFNKKVNNFLSSGKKLVREVQTGFDQNTRMPIIEKQEIPLEHMPLIVVIIDEMADLMMVAGKDVESSIQRLAQMARASGIHLIAATQRPSVDVITGTIKANFPSRISYRVASKFDSRTILNEMGAEQLLGSGDMLFLTNGANLLRLHGCFVSENEIKNVVSFINAQSTNEIQKDITKEAANKINEPDFIGEADNSDELYQKAVSIILHHQKASTSFLQRHLRIGYNRAASIIEQMEKEGIITEANHVGKRNVLKKNI